MSVLGTGEGFAGGSALVEGSGETAGEGVTVGVAEGSGDSEGIGVAVGAVVDVVGAVGVEFSGPVCATALGTNPVARPAANAVTAAARTARTRAAVGREEMVRSYDRQTPWTERRLPRLSAKAVPQ